jgi:hypothetical protein
MDRRCPVLRPLTQAMRFHGATQDERFSNDQSNIDNDFAMTLNAANVTYG